MSIVSSKAYRNYLNDDINFLKYYETITQQNILGKLYIGSRPAKRKKSNEIKNLRAITCGFACTQIRLLLPALLLYYYYYFYYYDHYYDYDYYYYYCYYDYYD